MIEHVVSQSEWGLNMATQRRFLKVIVVGGGEGTANPNELANFFKDHTVSKMTTEDSVSVIVYQEQKWEEPLARRVMSVQGPMKHLLELRDLMKELGYME